MIGQSLYLAVIEIINAQTNFNKQRTTFFDPGFKAEITKHGVFQTRKP